MKVLLTGGAGYIGSACLRWLLSHGHEAFAYDNLSEGNAQAVPANRLIVGDILDTARFTQALGEREIDVVMHFAAAASVPDSIKDPRFYYQLNVLGTRSVVEAMIAADVRRLIFSSTAATFGLHGEMPLREDSPQVPAVPYGRTKLSAEWLIHDYAEAYNLGYTILRYFNASGADTNGHHGESRRKESHLIPLVLEAALGKRREVLIYGDDFPTRDGTCVRDFVHIEDLAQAHLLSMESLTTRTRRSYNLGSGTGMTVREVFRACEECVGRPIPHRVVERRPGDPAVLVASPAKIMRELGWEPRYTDIQDIVASAWRWHRDHPMGYVSPTLPPTAVVSPWSSPALAS